MTEQHEAEAGDTLDADTLGSFLCSLPGYTPVLLQTQLGGDAQSAVVDMSVETCSDGGHVVVLRDYYVAEESNDVS